MRKVLAIAAVLALSACGPTKDDLKRDVEAYGFSNVVIGDWAWWGCSKDDNFHYHFTAVNSAGRPVSGLICRGWMKGATVRID